MVRLVLNLVLPTVVLIWGGDWLGLPPWAVLVVGLLGPLGYGLWALAVARKVDHVSVLGVVSVLLTGGVGLLGLDAGWIAVKEAAIPLIFGVILLVSALTPWPVVQTLLLDAELLDVARIHARIAERGEERAFAGLLRGATWAMAGSFAVSAGLNYALASYLVRSPSGTEAFNQEIGQLTAWSFPVVAVPSLAIALAVMAWLLRGLTRITGLTLDELVGERTR